MWFLAVVDQQGWINLAITGVVSGLGAGGIASIATTWMNNRKDERNQERLDVNAMTLRRVEELEARDISCNKRVTELERRNNELEREAGRLRDRLLQLEDQLITAVISADSSMKIIAWNEGATLMFGYLASDVVGKDVDILVPGYMKQRHHDAYEKAINDLDAITNWVNARPVVGVHKDGHEFNIVLLITSFRNTVGSKFFEARINKPRTS